MKNFPSIKKNASFRTVYAAGSSKASGTLIMYAHDNGGQGLRIGISASRKVGNSVVRHRAVRRVRELFRAYQDQTVQGKDIVVVVRNRAAAAAFEELKRDYEKLLCQHKLLLR